MVLYTGTFETCVRVVGTSETETEIDTDVSYEVNVAKEPDSVIMK
jgi:hypothetical protein